MYLNQQASTRPCCRKSHRMLKAFFITALFALSLFFPSSESQAQCPTGWLGPYTTTISVVLDCGSPPTPTPKTLTVTYCIPGPGIGPSTQYRITKVAGSLAGCGNDISILRKVGRELIRSNPAGFSCSGACPIATPNWQATWQTCWKPFKINGVVLYWEPCSTSPNAETCMDQYIVCCRCDGTLVPFYQNSTSSTDACYDSSDPECVSRCPAPAAPEPVVCP